MAREYAKLSVSLWSDDNFRDLPQTSQLLYLQLLSSPSLSYAGVADWRPARIAKLGSAWTAADVRTAAQPLQRALFIVVDEDTEEVLVRSFLRHDGVMAQPRLAVAMVKAHAGIASHVLRGVLVHELRRLHAEQPDLAGWRTTKDKSGQDQDGQALALLGLRAVDPATLTQALPGVSGSEQATVGGSLTQRLGDDLASVSGSAGATFGPNAEEDFGSVWGSVTPAPDPAPAPATPTPSLRSGVGPRVTPEREVPLPRCEKHSTVLDPPDCRDCRDARIAVQAWESAQRDRITCPPCPEHHQHSSRNCPRCAQDAERDRQQAAVAGYGSWRDRFAALDGQTKSALTVAS